MGRGKKSTPVSAPGVVQRGQRPESTHVSQRQQDGRPLVDKVGGGSGGGYGGGPPGDEGPEGLEGQPGVPGARGAAGAAGAIGPSGATGMPGLDGLEGDIGADGLPGTPGPTGSAGATGGQGPAGFGIPGTDGEAGEIGFDGLPGPQGIQGPQGVQGPQGPAGLAMHGWDGLDGEPGDMGIPGPPGTQLLYINNKFQILRADGAWSSSFTRDAAYTWLWEAFGGFEFVGRNGNNILADPRRTLLGDTLLSFNGRGYYAPDDVTVAIVSALNAAGFRFRAAEDFTVTNRGGTIEFQVAAIGATLAATVWTINSDGRLIPSPLKPKSQYLDGTGNFTEPQAGRAGPPGLDGADGEDWGTLAPRRADIDPLTSPDMSLGVLRPPSDIYVPADRSAVVNRSYLVASGKKLSIGLNARMRIL